MATPFKHPRTGVWWFRKAIPPHLRPLFGGRREYTKTLGTKDRAEAIRKFHRVGLEYEAAIRERQAEANGRPETLRGIAREWAKEGNKFTDPDGEVDFIWTPDSDPETDDWVAPPEQQIPRNMLVSVFGAEIAAKNEAVARAVLWEAIHAEAANAHTLEEAFEGWLRSQKPKHKTELDWKTAVKEFGAATPVNKVRRVDVVAYLDRMRDKGRAPGTLAKKLTALRTLFAYANEREWCKDNPTDGVKRPTVSRAARQTRLTYTNEHLKTIFAGPVHAEGRRPRGGAGEAAVWLPILALYTGARLEELGQLSVANVREEDRVWRIEITDVGEDQSIKTAGSRRKVPLHPDIAQAFAAYVRTVKSGPLFPALRHDNKGRVTGNWSKWWGRYQDAALRISDARFVFHSFRHTFKDLCRDAEIPKEVHDRLTGHSARDVGSSYGSGHSLKTLATHMARIKVPREVSRLVRAALHPTT